MTGCLAQARLAATSLLVACSSFPPEDREVAGWHDGVPVTYGEVCRHLRSRDPDAFWRSLEGCVLDRVTRVEAEELGVRVPEPVVDGRTESRLREWEERLQDAARAEGEGPVDPAAWLEEVAGIAISDFHASVRRHTEVELLQDRLLRYEQLTSPRVEVSIFGAADADEAARLLERARSDEGKGAGSTVTLLEDDLDDEAVREALFSAREGSVVGPFPARGAFQVFRVVGATPPREIPWPEAAASIEADLGKRPVPMAEYDRWRRRILLRHGFAAAPAPGEPG